MSDYISHRALTNGTLPGGQRVVQDGDRFLVEKDKDGSYQFVEPTDRFVSYQDLDKGFGLWQDKKATHGIWPLKHVDRPLDGKIQPDEVLPFAKEYQKAGQFATLGGMYPGYPLLNRSEPSGGSLQLHRDGTSDLTTQWQANYKWSPDDYSLFQKSYLL